MRLRILLVVGVASQASGQTCDRNSACNMTAGEWCGSCGGGGSDVCCSGPCDISLSVAHSCLTCSRGYEAKYSLSSDCSCLASTTSNTVGLTACYDDLGRPDPWSSKRGAWYAACAIVLLANLLMFGVLLQKLSGSRESWCGKRFCSGPDLPEDVSLMRQQGSVPLGMLCIQLVNALLGLRQSYTFAFQVANFVSCATGISAICIQLCANPKAAAARARPSILLANASCIALFIQFAIWAIASFYLVYEFGEYYHKHILMMNEGAKRVAKPLWLYNPWIGMPWNAVVGALMLNFRRKVQLAFASAPAEGSVNRMA